MRDRHCITRSSRDTVCSFPKGLTSKAGKEDIVGSATPPAPTPGPQRSPSQAPERPSPGPALTLHDVPDLPEVPVPATSKGPQRLVEVELEHPAVHSLLQSCLPRAPLRGAPQPRIMPSPPSPPAAAGRPPACRPPAAVAAPASSRHRVRSPRTLPALPTGPLPRL